MTATADRSGGASPVALPNYGIDADRVLATDSLLAAARRRLDGRYAIDQFGGDPHLMDLVAPIPEMLVRERVEGAEHLPRTGPALLVSNRGFGVVEPIVLGLAVRRAAGSAPGVAKKIRNTSMLMPSITKSIWPRRRRSAKIISLSRCGSSSAGRVRRACHRPARSVPAR